MHLSVYIFAHAKTTCSVTNDYLNRITDLTLPTPKDSEKVQILQTRYNVHGGQQVHLSI